MATGSDFDLVLEALETHQEHEREQLRAWAKLTCRQRLDWLWQAKLFAQRAQQAAAARRAAEGTSPPSGR